MNNILAIIQSSDLFRDLSLDEAHLLSEIVQYKEINPGIVFIEEGQIGLEAYIIASGLVKVYRLTDEGKEVIFGIRKPGEILGEMALLDEGTRSAHVATLQKTGLLCIPKQAFLNLIAAHPSVALGMIRTLSKRIRESTFMIEDIVSKQVIERMVNLLRTIAPYFPNNELTLSHEELAILLGATRPRVTEILHILEKEKKITLLHKKIIVHANVL